MALPQKHKCFPAKVLSAHCGKNLYNRSQATATKSLLDHNMNQLAIAHRVACNGAISQHDFCWPEKWPKNAKSFNTAFFGSQGPPILLLDQGELQLSFRERKKELIKIPDLASVLSSPRSTRLLPVRLFFDMCL